MLNIMASIKFLVWTMRCQSFFDWKPSLFVSLGINISVKAVFIFLTYSTIPKFPRLVNVCILLLKCWHASVRFGFFMPFLRLFILMLNAVSDWLCDSCYEQTYKITFCALLMLLTLYSYTVMNGTIVSSTKYSR